MAIKHKEECLDVLAKVVPEDEPSILAFAMRFHPKDNETINIVASLALLLGETFESVGNRENAMIYYRIALRCDVRCTEAFTHLMDKQMLSTQEQKNLLDSLDFRMDSTNMLYELYAVQIGKYETIDSIDEKFASIDTQFQLHGNVELAIAKAETYYYQHDVQHAHELCERIRQQDPFNARVIPVMVATMVELQKKRELYQYAHQMVDVYPKKACAWYTVACYYLLIRKLEAAQRFFQYVIRLDR